MDFKFKSIKGSKTKQAIDRSLSELIHIRNIDELTVKEVCENANVSRTSYYYYYKDINEAILEMFYYVDEYFRNHVRPIVLEMNFKDSLLTFSKYYFQMTLDYGIDYSKQVFFAQIKYSDPKVFSETRCFYKIPKEIFEKYLMDNGEKVETQIYTLTNSFIAVLRGVVFDWLIKGGNFELQEIGCIIMEDYIDGILSYR